jgi:hypothetical protein
VTHEEWKEEIDAAPGSWTRQSEETMLADWTADREVWQEETRALAGRVQRADADRTALLGLVRELRDVLCRVKAKWTYYQEPQPGSIAAAADFAITHADAALAGEPQEVKPC